VVGVPVSVAQEVALTKLAQKRSPGHYNGLWDVSHMVHDAIDAYLKANGVEFTEREIRIDGQRVAYLHVGGSDVFGVVD